MSEEFPRAEFEARLARLRTAMRAAQVAAMLLDDCEILAYFTGYETSLNRYRACVVPLVGPPAMVLRALDATPFRDAAWFQDCVPVADDEDTVEKLAVALEERGLGSSRIGFDPASHAMSVAVFERLRQRLSRASLVAMPGVPWELRLVKSPAEIARLSRAAGILDRTIADVIDAAEPGWTPRQAVAMASRRLLEQGADPAHIGYVGSAGGWDFLHRRADDAPLARGDTLHLELVARYRGYEAREMRCVVLGPVDDRHEAAARRLAALQDAQIAAMRPGAAARDVDAILRDGVLACGMRAEYPNISGYTLGYYSRLPLRSSDFTRTFSPSARWRIEAGMVFHMYTSAAGVSFSETVHVAAGGPERLTRLERRLFSKP